MSNATSPSNAHDDDGPSNRPRPRPVISNVGLAQEMRRPSLISRSLPSLGSPHSRDSASSRPPHQPARPIRKPSLRHDYEPYARIEYPPTPYIRNGEEIWPYHSVMSGDMHIQYYDLRVHKDRPRRPEKPYVTVKTEQEVHRIMGFSEIPPLRGTPETISTLGRLEEVLAEERSLLSIERYGSKMGKFVESITNTGSSIRNLWKRAKNLFDSKRKDRGKKREFTDDIELQSLPPVLTSSSSKDLE